MIMSGYRDDLAYIHDAGFGHFARNAAPGLLEMLRQSRATRPERDCAGPPRPPSAFIIDLGCGSGIWARELSRAGYRVLGIDQSQAMLAIAQKRVPDGEFRRASFLTTPLPQCGAVTAIGECFSYLFDRRNTKERLFRHFRRIYDALVPGGLLIFDVAGPGCIPGLDRQRKYWEGDDWAVLVEAVENRQRMFLTRRITSFRKVGKLYRRDEEIHRLRLFTRPELAGGLRRCGFHVRSLRGYGEMRFLPGRFGFVAHKP